MLVVSLCICICGWIGALMDCERYRVAYETAKRQRTEMNEVNASLQKSFDSLQKSFDSLLESSRSLSTTMEQMKQINGRLIVTTEKTVRSLNSCLELKGRH